MPGGAPYLPCRTSDEQLNRFLDHMRDGPDSRADEAYLALWRRVTQLLNREDDRSKELLGELYQAAHSEVCDAETPAERQFNGLCQELERLCPHLQEKA